MAYPLVSNVAEKLNNLIQEKVALLERFNDEIKKLYLSLTLIQAVLKDAETRRSKDGAMKIWLQKLKDVVYDADDVLAEWMIEALKSQAPDEGIGSSFSKKKDDEDGGDKKDKGGGGSEKKDKEGGGRAGEKKDKTSGELRKMGANKVYGGWYMYGPGTCAEAVVDEPEQEKWLLTVVH